MFYWKYNYNKLPLFEMSIIRVLPLLLLALIFILPLLQARRDDAVCKTIRCMDGYRCKEGNCVPQKRKAVKNRCMDDKLSHKISPVKCSPRDRIKSCTGAKNVLTCGFTSDGGRIDFKNDCSPCLNPAVAEFYRLSCADSPVFCTEAQDCINGKCFNLFNSDDDRNMQICNKSSDCDSPTELCVANKCVEKHQLLKTLRKGIKQYR